MPDENVDKWRQQGHIYLWKYLDNTRNYPGWHLTANEIFCNSFSELIKRMKAAQFNCQKSLNVSSPTKEILSIPNNRVGEAVWEAPINLILKHQKDQISDDYFSLEESENTVIISGGQQNLELLEECVLKIPKNKDYSIDIGDTQLWFW